VRGSGLRVDTLAVGMPIPAAPTDFAVAHVGIDEKVNKPAIRFSFTNNEPGATHVLQGNPVDGGGFRDLAEAGDGKSAVEYHFSSKQLGDKWKFRVRSEFSNEGSVSAWVLLAGNPTITLPKLPTGAVAINAPTGLAVAENTARGVTLTWNDNSNNENAHILRLRGPGLPAEGADIVIPHLDAGSYTMPINYPFADGLMIQHEKTYTAEVRARGGKMTTEDNTYYTDWTSEVTFTTLPEAVVLVNLPATVDCFRNTPFSFRVYTNVSDSTVIMDGGTLPAGLTLFAPAGSGFALIEGQTLDPETTEELTFIASDGPAFDIQTLTLRVLTPEFKFTNLPVTVTAWKTVEFEYVWKTNRDGIDWLCDGYVPEGLMQTANELAGIVTDNDGDYTFIARVNDMVLDTLIMAPMTIKVRTPGIKVLLKPNGVAVTPKTGEEWGEVKAPLSQLFKWDISAAPIGPIEVGSTVTISGNPDWLTLTGTQISGTPDESSTSEVEIEWTNGTFSGSTILKIVVPTIEITSSDTLTVYDNEAFELDLTSSPPSPPGIFSFVDENDVPTGVAIRAIADGTYTLVGKSHAVGTHTFEIAVTYGDEIGTQVFNLEILPVIELTDGSDEVVGWQGDPILAVLRYVGDCDVSEWILTNAPPGVELAELSCPGPYSGTKQVVAISGIPGGSGKWVATVVAQVCCDGEPKLHSRSIDFLIAGGYFLPWLHSERTLYDLQFDVRGTLTNRGVNSYYGIGGQDADEAQVQSVSSNKDEGSGKSTATETTTTRTVKIPARKAEILKLKRGDKVALAIVPRDGRSVLTSLDGVTEVSLAIRDPEGADQEYLFDLAATETELNLNSYFHVDLEVTSDFLDTVMGDDGVIFEPVELIAEIRCKLNGASLSSDNFLVMIAEDVHH
jgi:hypothetical protein